MTIIINILPLILDYLGMPFSLLKTNSYIRQYGKKYRLSLETQRAIKQNILTKYKWKYINLTISCGITDNTMKYFKDTSSLTIRAPLVTNFGFSHIGNLEHLCLLHRSELSDEALKYMPNLKTLELEYNNRITDNGLQLIPKIETLTMICNTIITNHGLSYLRNIVTLNLGMNNKITDDGLIYISTVEILHLDHNLHITNNGLLCLPRLKELYVSHNHNITLEGLQKLPNCLTRHYKSRGKYGFCSGSTYNDIKFKEPQYKSPINLKNYC